MLEVSGLTGGWGATTIVEDFSLSVSTGETVAIIGRKEARSIVICLSYTASGSEANAAHRDVALSSVSPRREIR